MFKRLVLLVRPYWGRIAVAAILSLLISGVNGGLAWLVKPALDGIFLKKDTSLLALLPLGILILYLFKGLFSFFQAYLMKSTSFKVARDLRNSLYNHTLLLPVNDFKRESTGAMLSRLINDAGQLQGLISYAIKDIFVEGATIIALIFVAFYRRWDLALLAVVVLPFAIYRAKKLGIKVRKITKEAQKNISLITEFLSESFSGIKMIKVYGRGSSLSKVFKKKNQNYYRNMVRATRLTEFTSLMMDVIGGLGIASVLWYGGSLVIKDVITAGELFSFITAIFMIYTPARRLASANNSIQQAKASMERLDELFDRQPEAEGEEKLNPFTDSIEFRNVSFRYPTSKHSVLNGINLKIRRGEIVAIVGRSGAGKTSLCDLIPRFYEPTDGAIYIDGVNIANVSLKSLREQVGLVSQDIILFNDTVMANIMFGNPDASDEDIVKAAKASYAHEFILELPDGYDTVIGERGVMISGGQRQRLSIARAILKNPPILILDEATSSLDTESEMIVQSALDILMKDRTTFVIAHRLSTVQKSDRIVVLEKGRIAETGSREELMQKNGIYKRFYDLQLSSAEINVSHL
ncbi:MAG: ABC transporter ATP-binding protein [Thermodesulfovibrionales bacterium]|nr:ABC transporter ATP-binding protein [Thermodesulfovibrionales bacterium]